MAHPKGGAQLEYMTGGNLEWLPSYAPPACEPEVVPHDAPQLAYKSPPDLPGLIPVAPHQSPALALDDGKERTADVSPSTAPEKIQNLDEAATQNPKSKNRRWIKIGLCAGVVAAMIAGAISGIVIGLRMRNQNSETASTANGSDSGVNGGGGGSGSGMPNDGVASRSTPLTIGTTLTATFTFYGRGDMRNSSNCNTVSNSCGFYTQPGFAASVSENLFGMGMGQGKGPECGSCWRLDASESAERVRMNSSIVVMVNHLCPAKNNPVCGQKTLEDTNQYGSQVDFNLCTDSKASEALFIPGSGLAVGNATKVSCDGLWNGQVIG